jgi:hypothetical protein
MIIIITPVIAVAIVIIHQAYAVLDTPHLVVVIIIITIHATIAISNAIIPIMDSLIESASINRKPTL